MAMIEIEHVSKWYGNFQVLHDCNLDLDKGDIVVVCGPSGSGKSTLIKTVNGLEPVQQGSVRFNGKCVTDLKNGKLNLPQIRSTLGMVFQHFELFPHLSVAENVCLAQIKVLNRAPEQARQRAALMLDRVGMKMHIDKYPGQLSGGQQQRVAIARGLAMDPMAMLFDEPTSALDPEMVNEVLDVMVELAKDGMTMMVVTHEMGFAGKVANRIVFMDHGSIVDDVSTGDFFEGPSTRSERATQFLQKILSH